MPSCSGLTTRVTSAFALTASVLLTGCAGTDEPPPAAGTSASSSAGEASTSAPSSSAAPAPSSPTGTAIEVSVAAGQVSGDTGRIPAPLGEQVTITVASDVADEIHVHGYDLTADVGPDLPGTLTFPATLPGVFEVELEQSGTLLFTIQIG